MQWDRNKYDKAIIDWNFPPSELKKSMQRRVFKHKLIETVGTNPFFYFVFVKKYLLVDGSGYVISGPVDERGMFACHTNQIGTTKNNQSNCRL